MTATYKLLMASTILGLLGTSAIAQTFDAAEGRVFGTENRLDDNLEDLDEDIEDDFEVEDPTFGNEGRELGFTGSISARGTATDGNTDVATIGLGARFGFFDGINGHEMRLSYSYAEEDGDELTNNLLAGYDYTRDFSDTFYGFATAVLAYDEFDSFETDAFVGVGVGYRVFDTADVQWTVQAGPGYRYLEADSGEEIDEAALSVSSNYYNRINEDMFITNDTDVLASDRDTYVTNDFGVTVSMSNALALRTNLFTEYRTDPEPGFDDTDNTLGVSVVYSFN
ncbi:DUF481 domain-containing protein [Limimaricola hongkongensis]|uniref:Salt-stress induced outer membrane protein n=1 Tax=Limimaricola hongkongensis DSM 17492 TaxID=1122180 RepID=A0A017HHW9_9RHOB|nr:DUF481 domain-containing protein [Limimaricola hongkongensis]EYD73389.1 Salt-stress induced outer membrane protein [Limimaricola hongkongensis DSM 17492]